MGHAERERLAHRWIETLHLGGMSEAEAVALIGAVSAPSFSAALEIIHVSDIPCDRAHRNAWRRSHNGGLIWIDEQKARAIDEERLWKKYELTPPVPLLRPCEAWLRHDAAIPGLDFIKGFESFVPYVAAENGIGEGAEQQE